MSLGKDIRGSRKGIPNKVTKELKEMILGALDDVGGQEYLARQAEENPTAFMGLIGKVLPKDVKAEVTADIKTDVYLRPQLTKEEWIAQFGGK